MIKEVKYNGYSASPSDYECADGDLAMSFNTINEDGSLRPIMQPKEIVQLNDAVVKCVHETSNYIHYIVVKDNNVLSWRTVDGDCIDVHNFSTAEIYQITPVGNTLVVLTTDGIYYFLWKDNEYISLGNELPELNVSPYISTNLMNTTSFALSFGISDMAETNTSITGDGYIGSEICKELYNGTIDTYTLFGTVRQNVYERVFAIINHYTTLLKRRGFFTEPFYVRFAYRMFDGSHVRHTVPVLLVPTTSGKPLMGVYINENGGSIFNPVYSVSQLSANIALPDNIDDWSDVITHVDIYVTEPLADYTDSAEGLISLSKLPFDNIDIKPKCMTYFENKCVWKDIPSMIEHLNNAQFYFLPGTPAVFQNGAYANVVEPTSREGFYLAFDTSAYEMVKVVQNSSGQTIAEAIELEGIPGIENYTVFKVTEHFTSPYGVTFKLTDETLDVTLNTFYIHHNAEIISQFYLDTKRIDGQDYNDVLTSCNAFYNIAELSIREIKDGLSNDTYDKPIPIKEGMLLNLTTRETLSDLGQGHNRQVSKYSFNYNNRLNVILEKERIRNACTSLKKQNPAINNIVSIIEINVVSKAYVEIYDNGQNAYIEIPIGGDTLLENICLFSFPCNNAKNLMVYTNNYHLQNLEYEFCECRKYTIPLKQHEFLNLSYAFNMFAPLYFASFETITESDFVIPSNDTIEYGNIIRLSDVNNPFRFSEEYTVSLPVSKIYALSTATKALSQGQFGQYPLYAFTSDGIWALEITSAGTYSARQPLSRDVVIKPESITQLDSAVLLATQRGIMLLSGSVVTCISDRLNTEDIFDITELPKVDKIMELYDGTLSKNDIKLVSFGDFIKNCRMLYDYPHQHLIVYNPDIRYAYVYSFKSQLWGMTLSNLKENVNSYPEALAMTNDNRLVDFSQYSNNNNKVLLITRPFKMELPDVHKTISTIIQRGNLNDRNIAQVLYGSNDMNNWFVVWSSNNVKMSGFRGNPYKYYRIALVRNLYKSESLQGFSVQYEQRLTNKLR